MTATTFHNRGRLASLAAASAALICAAAGPVAGAPFGQVGGGSHVGAPSGGYHGGRSFRGSSPRAEAPFVASRSGHGGPGRDPGRISERSFNHSSSADRVKWSGGGWRHAWRNGRFGWWWVVDDDWFLYDAPSYPYPTDVPDDVDSDDPSAGAYYCEDPPGYYPDVATCNVEWESAPPQ